MEEHGPYCNCEDCWWSHGQEEVCSTCGCLVGEGCPCSDEKDPDE